MTLLKFMKLKEGNIEVLSSVQIPKNIVNHKNIKTKFHKVSIKRIIRRCLTLFYISQCNFVSTTLSTVTISRSMPSVLYIYMYMTALSEIAYF